MGTERFLSQAEGKYAKLSAFGSPIEPQQAGSTHLMPGNRLGAGYKPDLPQGPKALIAFRLCDVKSQVLIN